MERFIRRTIPSSVVMRFAASRFLLSQGLRKTYLPVFVLPLKALHPVRASGTAFKSIMLLRYGIVVFGFGMAVVCIIKVSAVRTNKAVVCRGVKQIFRSVRAIFELFGFSYLIICQLNVCGYV